MIKVWANEFHHIVGRDLPDFTDPKVVQHAYDVTLERLASLEDIGFEGVFFAEHHFLAALNPNPNLMVAALARMTTKLRLGVMGNVLGFHQPWRLFEDLAMLDYITSGRLEIGFATGIPLEFEFVGIPPEEVRPRYAEAMDFLEEATANRIVTFHGDYYNYDELHLMPRPLDVGRRRKWMAIYTPETAARAARRNYKICTAYQPVETAAVAFDAYREAAAEMGTVVGPDDLALRRTICIWDNDEDAAALQKETLEAAIKRAAAQFAPLQHRRDSLAKLDPAALHSGIRDVETPKQDDNTPTWRRKEGVPLGAPNFKAMTDEFIHGSPASVAEKLIDQCRRTGAGNILSIHSDVHTEEELDHLYQLWEQVVPILNKAEIPVNSR